MVTFNNQPTNHENSSTRVQLYPYTLDFLQCFFDSSPLPHRLLKAQGKRSSLLLIRMQRRRSSTYYVSCRCANHDTCRSYQRAHHFTFAVPLPLYWGLAEINSTVECQIYWILNLSSEAVPNPPSILLPFSFPFSFPFASLHRILLLTSEYRYHYFIISSHLTRVAGKYSTREV